MKPGTIVCNGYFGCCPTYPGMQAHVPLIDSQQFTVLVVSADEIAKHLVVFSNFFLPLERNTLQALRCLYLFVIFRKISHISHRIDIIISVRNCQFEYGMRRNRFSRRISFVLTAYYFRFFISFSIFISNYINAFTRRFTLRKRIFLHQVSLLIIQQYTEAIDSLYNISSCTCVSVQGRDKWLKLHSCTDYTFSFAQLTSAIEQIIFTSGNAEN